MKRAIKILLLVSVFTSSIVYSGDAASADHQSPLPTMVQGDAAAAASADVVDTAHQELQLFRDDGDGVNNHESVRFEIEKTPTPTRMSPATSDPAVAARAQDTRAEIVFVDEDEPSNSDHQGQRGAGDKNSRAQGERPVDQVPDDSDTDAGTGEESSVAADQDNEADKGGNQPDPGTGNGGLGDGQNLGGNKNKKNQNQVTALPLLMRATGFVAGYVGGESVTSWQQGLILLGVTAVPAVLQKATGANIPLNNLTTGAVLGELAAAASRCKAGTLPQLPSWHEVHAQAAVLNPLTLVKRS